MSISSISTNKLFFLPEQEVKEEAIPTTPVEQTRNPEFPSFKSPMTASGIFRIHPPVAPKKRMRKEEDCLIPPIFWIFPDGTKAFVSIGYEAEGEFCTFGRIILGQKALIEGIHNQNLGVKGLKPAFIRDFTIREAVIKERMALLEPGFREIIDIVTCYNPLQFLAVVHDFLLVEFIPLEVEQLTIAEILPIFEQSYQRGLCPDLRISNLRRRSETGKLVLCDFREIPPQSSDERDAIFRAMIRDLEPVCPELIKAAQHSIILSRLYSQDKTCLLRV